MAFSVARVKTSVGIHVVQQLARSPLAEGGIPVVLQKDVCLRVGGRNHQKGDLGRAGWRNMARKTDDRMRIQIILIGWACMTVCLVSYTAAFSHGASLAACSDMRPKHIRAQPQNPKKNYVTIYTNRSFYLPGDRVPVTVRSTRDFMGFLLQARVVASDQVAGTFVFIPPSSKQLGCFKDGDAVTHSDKSLKRNLSFVWRAPDQPIGDIKFCLSVVQSYFVYWARIESAIVFDLTKNKTMLPPEDKTSTITPTPLPPSFTRKTNFSTNKASDLLNITLAQDTNLAFDNKSVTMAGTILLQHVTSTVDGGRGLNAQNGRKNHSSLFEKPVTTPLWTGGMDLRMPNKSDRILEPSLQPQVLENPRQHLIFQLNASSPEASYRIENVRRVSTFQLCSTCDMEMPVLFNRSPLEGSKSKGKINTAIFGARLSSKEIKAFSLGDNVAITRFEITPSSLPLDTSAPPPTGKSLQLHHKHDELEMFSRLAPNDKLEGQPVTKKMSANFLQQSEQEDSAAEAAEEAGHTLPWMTKPAREVVVPGKGGESPGRGMHLAAAQLGILLGCSAALGMALAAGLRCIHAQYCHKRTEVSFSEPETNVITVRESGEMMEFRKVRENSFVLVQAEYNWITPSSNGKK